MPIPAACVCHVCRISQSSGCPGICRLLGQIFDFWPPARLPAGTTAQTVGISSGQPGGVSGIQPLGSPSNGFQSHPHRQKVWFSSSPVDHCFLLSDSLSLLYYLAGAIRRCRSGRLVCLVNGWLLVPSPVPTSLSQTVWRVEATGCSVPHVPPKHPAARPCPVPIACFWLRQSWKKKEILHKAIKAKKSSAQEGWAPVLV